MWRLVSVLQQAVTVGGDFGLASGVGLARFFKGYLGMGYYEWFCRAKVEGSTTGFGVWGRGRLWQLGESWSPGVSESKKHSWGGSLVNCPGIGTETSKLGQDSPCGILWYIWESWEEQRGILTLVLEGKQKTARQRTGKRVFRVGWQYMQRCRERRRMACYRNIKQHTAPDS